MYAEVHHHHHHIVGIMYDCVFSEVWTNPDETLRKPCRGRCQCQRPYKLLKL